MGKNKERNILETYYFDKASFFLLQKMFETIPIPMILIGMDNNILFLNRAYTEYLHFKEEDYIGKNVKNFISNSRMPIVMQTKKAEISNYHLYIDGPAAGQEAIVHRIPIVEDGEVIGCFGMVLFQTIEELMDLTNKNKQLKEELNYYKQEMKPFQNTKYSIDNILGSSLAITDMKNKIYKFSNSKSNILIQGESGSGKELVAHSIHSCSQRREYPFVRLNCAAIPENLFESEMFGYEDGAFTGAAKGGKKGKFELANKGTLFLDEIGELPLFMQAKLLRVLQEKELTRVGGSKNICIDVRVIVATNKNLEQMVKEEKFREDLYFRLNILNIKVPPLRERIDDLKILLAYCLNKLCEENGVYKHITNEAIKFLEKYNWKGNIRELFSSIEKMYFTSDTDIIDIQDIPANILREVELGPVKIVQGNGLDDMIDDLEKEAVKITLENTDQNISKTANILKISRPRLYRILDKMKRRY